SLFLKITTQSSNRISFFTRNPLQSAESVTRLFYLSAWGDIMIGKIKWIYPNTSELNRSGCRGGLAEREKLRKALGFDLVEMPGDYVKNISEMSRTDLALGSPFLVREDVAN